MPIARHSLATMAAVTLGGTQLFTAKGTTRHRGLGWSWVGLVTYVTTSSFFISGLKLWGRVQLDTFTKYLEFFFAGDGGLPGPSRQYQAAQKLDETGYILALLVTGVLSLWPGRAMHGVLLGV